MEGYRIKKVYLSTTNEKSLNDIEKEVLNNLERVTEVNYTNFKNIDKSVKSEIHFDNSDELYIANTKILNIAENIKLAIMTFENKINDSFVQLLVHNKNQQKVTTYINNKKIASYNQDAPTLNNVFLKEYDEYDYQEDILPQISVPCIQNGCCTFGSMKFKWCGAGCGSGTPINSLDTCCRSHDYCYGSYKSYPDRCTCDKTLIDCAASTSNGYKHLITGTFVAKRLAMGC